MTTISDVWDSKRGCGWRRSGLYFMGGEASRECLLLPIPLETCKCCGKGIKPSRGYTWVDAQLIIKGLVCPGKDCGLCLIKRSGRSGLLWIGADYYKSPGDFIREAMQQGISRRIPAQQIPRGFEIGKTSILIGHRKAIARLVPETATIDDDGRVTEDEVEIADVVKTGRNKTQFTPGIIAVFVPNRIEYVVNGDESEEKLESLEKRGITLVRVHRNELVQGVLDGDK